MSWNGYENNVLLRNEGCGEDGVPRFVDVAMALGADDSIDARGTAVADFDNDGDLDLAINHNPGDRNPPITVPATLYRNDLGHRRSWAAVELVGTAGNRDAVGAEVTVVADGRRHLRLHAVGNGYASQQSARLLFGLGDADRIDRLEVRWPGGRVETFADLPVRRLLRVTEGGEVEVAELVPSAMPLGTPSPRPPTVASARPPRATPLPATLAAARARSGAKGGAR